MPSFSLDPGDLRKGFDIPVKEFKGVLTGIDMRSQEFPKTGGGTRVAYYFTFHFQEVDVIESDTPWPFPIVDVDVPYSGGQDNTQWGTLAKSLAQFLTSDELKSVMTLGSHKFRMHWKKTPGHDYGEDFNARPDPETGVKPHRVLAAWECQSVEGRDGNVNGQVSVDDKILALLDGKTLGEFNSKVLQLPEVKANPTLVAALINQQWIADQMMAGKVTVDAENRYHVEGS